MHVRNQIGQRDVDETARSQHQNIGQGAARRIEPVVAGNAAHHRRQPCQDIEEQGPLARIAGVQQNDEVADLLRNFVGGNRRGGEPAKTFIRQECRGNQHTVGEVMDRIAHQNERSPGASLPPIMAVVMIMTV